MDNSDFTTPAETMESQAPARWIDRIRAAAARQREEQELEAADPVYREKKRVDRLLRLEAEKAQHEQERLEGYFEHLKRCGVGEREARIVIEMNNPDLARWPALKITRDFWKDRRADLLLLRGPTGVGKSVAAAELIGMCRFDYMHPDFGPTWAWPTIVPDLGHYALAGDLCAGNLFGEQAEKHMNRLTRYRLLVIDELGQETWNAAWNSKLERIVGERHRQRRKTVLISNLGKEEVIKQTPQGPRHVTVDRFKEQYGERIARRIRDDGIPAFANPQKSLFTTQLQRAGSENSSGGNEE